MLSICSYLKHWLHTYMDSNMNSSCCLKRISMKFEKNLRCSSLTCLQATIAALTNQLERTNVDSAIRLGGWPRGLIKAVLKVTPILILFSYIHKMCYGIIYVNGKLKWKGYMSWIFMRFEFRLNLESLMLVTVKCKNKYILVIRRLPIMVNIFCTFLRRNT